jgi:hypothetical protein
MPVTFPAETSTELTQPAGEAVVFAESSSEISDAPTGAVTSQTLTPRVSRSRATTVRFVHEHLSPTDASAR